MMRSTTPLHSTPPHFSPPKARLDFLHRRAFAFLSHFRPISAVGFFPGDGILALHPSLQLDRKKRPSSLPIRAAAKGKKPPPKPASRGVIIGAILLPLAMAGSAILVGRLLLQRIEREAWEESEELERRFNPSRLLPGGKTEEEWQLEKESEATAESTNTPRTRSRPKREE